MATFKDFELVPGSPPSREILAKLVTEPTEEWIRNFGRNFQDANYTYSPPEVKPASMGKFVAFNSLILMAPFERVLLHRDIAQADAEGVARLAIPYEPFSLELTDAGMFMIHGDTSGNVEGVVIAGQSTDYGRADQAGRERTAGFLRAALGGNLEVTT
jgi:hypothetical protein